MNPSAQWETDLATNDQEYYQQIYQYEGLEKNKQDIEVFLSRAKQIPRQQLTQIIGAAYQSNGPNFDSKKSFYMALKLIACAQNNINPSSPILSTDTPLPSFEDYDLITNKDRRKYTRIFHAAGSLDGYLNGQDAMKILMRSKLPVAILSQIWNLSDVRQEGKLDIHGFIIAMHYIAKCMGGDTTLPESKVPRSILLSAFEDNPQLLSSLNNNNYSMNDNDDINTNILTTSTSPSIIAVSNTSQVDASVKDDQTNENQLFSPINSSSPWIINDNEYTTYVKAFKKIDTQNHGYIEGSQAVGFFNHSNLPPSDLANVWDLADTKNIGRLNVDEFAIAIHLIRRLLGGSSFSSFPPSLQNTLLSQVHAKPEPPKSPTSPKENHEELKAKTTEIQNNIKKEQIMISGLNNDLEKQDELLITLRETVKTLEENLQQTINQKIELQHLLNTMKKTEMDKRHKIATLEREYNNNQSEIKSLKALHQQQLVFSNVSDKQLAVAQQQKDQSVEDLALAQDGQFDKLPDYLPPTVKQNIPKPPPPSSRHHRTPSIKSVNATSNVSSTRKPPAPPPSKKNRASVVNMPLSPTIAIDKSIKEDDENETISSPSSTTDSSNVIDSTTLSEPQKVQSISTSTQQEEIVPSSPSFFTTSSIQNQEVSSKEINENVDQQKQQNIIFENDAKKDDDESEESDEEEDSYSSDSSNEAATNNDEISTTQPSGLLKSEQTTSTPATNQNENIANEVKENENKGDDISAVMQLEEKAVTGTQSNNNNNKEISESSKVDDSIAIDESRGIDTDFNKESEDSIVLQDTAKATSEVINTTNGNNIENQSINIAKDNSKPDDLNLIANDNKNDEENNDHKDSDKKEESNLTKNIDDEVVSPQTNIKNDNEISKPTDEIDRPIKVSESTSKTENENVEKQEQQDDNTNKEIKIVNDNNNNNNNNNINNNNSTPSAGSLTSTKGDDHDFEVVENTSTSSSFMSASMGMDDDVMDEFDAAFAEVLPDAKVVTSNNNNTLSSSTSNIKQNLDGINQPTANSVTTKSDNLNDVDDFDKAFGNSELDSTPITTNTIVNKNDNEKNNDDDLIISSATQNEQAKEDDPFWVDSNTSIKNSFENSFTSESNNNRDNNKPKNDLGFSDAFTPSSGFGDAFTSSGFGDSFTTTTALPNDQDDFINNNSNDTITKNVINNNNNNNLKQIDNYTNDDLFSSTKEFSNIFEQNKTTNSQTSISNPFEEFVEKINPVPTEINQQVSSIASTTQGNIFSADKDNFKGIVDTQNKSNEQFINTTITTNTATPSIAVPDVSKSTGSIVSQQKPSSLLSSSSSKKVDQKQQQQSSKHAEDDYQASSSKGKHKGLFSLSSMLPKGKKSKSKSKSKSNKKEKGAITDNNTISQSTATLSSLHSHTSNHSNNNNHGNDYLETSLPQLTEQEVMANLREFGNDTEAVTTIVNMGFTPEIAKEALKRYDYDVTKALNFLLDQ